MEDVAAGSLIICLYSQAVVRCKPQTQFNNRQWLSVAHSRLGLT